MSALVGAIANLINNAIEAAGVSTHVNIHVLVDNDQIFIEIEDEGPGIPEHLVSKVTEAFFTTKSQGTGLGLSVVNAIARSHHGVFSIRNGEVGAIATLRLPIFDGVKYD